MEFLLPELGEGIYEAEVVEWLVRPGENVRHGQSVAEIMTDKATIELPSTLDGTVTELKVEPGDTVQIGTLLFTYEKHSGSEPVTASAEEMETDRTQT